MSNTGNSIKLDPIREIAIGSLTTSYQIFGDPYLRDAFKEWMSNFTNASVYLSDDGVTDKIKLPPFSGRAYDNKTDDQYRKATTQWYIRIDAVPAIPSGYFSLEVEYV